METIKYFLVCVVLLVFGVTANAAVNLKGNYYCNGYDPFGNSKYNVQVNVKKIGNTYSVMWNLGNGDIYTGSGVLNEAETTFSVLFYKNMNVRSATMAVYQIVANGHIRGQWVMSKEAKKIGFEDCVIQG